MRDTHKTRLIKYLKTTEVLRQYKQYKTWVIQGFQPQYFHSEN